MTLPKLRRPYELAMPEDLRYALRGLLRLRGFTATAVLTLALGASAPTSTAGSRSS